MNKQKIMVETLEQIRKQKIMVETEMNIWKKVEYTNKWNDLITKHGWILMGICKEGCIVMQRDGYINRFKEEVV